MNASKDFVAHPRNDNYDTVCKAGKKAQNVGDGGRHLDILGKTSKCHPHVPHLPGNDNKCFGQQTVDF